VRVTVANSTRGFDVAPLESVLEAALRASWRLPHSCRGGNCGSCRARLLGGEVDYPHGRPLGLSDAEIAAGEVLLCQARARTDLLLELREQRTPQDIVVKRLPCRIERSTPLSHDVMGIYLKLPAAEAFDFSAGQYIDILLPNGQRRSFSIAAPPHDARLLELHVRHVAGGAFSERLFHETLQGTLLQIEGPLGQFHYHEHAAHRPPGDLRPADPMLLVGGGTGLAPLLSILRHVIELELDRDRELHLYWGVRAERDLYAQPLIEELGRRAPRLTYTPVLSEPDSSWPGRRGLVHAVALEDWAQRGGVSRLEVYAAGPPAMIEALRRECASRGVPQERVYFDSFDYAKDAPALQRSNAETKS
jgi:CDP-4-dehydro-6-deoxyglucose reductase